MCGRREQWLESQHVFVIFGTCYLVEFIPHESNDNVFVRSIISFTLSYYHKLAWYQTTT